MTGFRIHDEAADQHLAGSAGVIAYLPRILLYPLRGHAPPVILLVTLLLALGGRGLAGLLPLILGVSFLAHYAIRVIENTSFGHAAPPRLTGDALMIADGFTLSALVAPALLLVLWYRDDRIAIYALALLLPAHWLALATTQSLLAACHPLRLLQIIAVSGSSYLAVCVLGAAAIAAGQWLSSHMASLLLIAAWMYLLLAACHLLGFVAYQRHERLGIGVRVVRPSRAREQGAAQRLRLDALMQQIRARLTAGDPDGAAKLLLDTASGPGDSRRFHEDLYERLKDRHLRGLALTQAARLISLLLERKLMPRALEIFENALDLDARFQPETALQLPALAQQALDTRQYALLARILAAAESAFEGDPALRLLDRVRISELVDHRRDEAAARRLLESLGDLDAHPQAAELRAYARVLAVGRAFAPPKPPVAGGS